MAPEKKELSMEMRVLIAFALSALILFLYIPLQKRYFPPAQQPTQQAPAKPANTPAAGSSATPGQQSGAQSPGAAPTTAAPAAAKAPAKRRAGKAGKASVREALAIKQAAEETEKVVENDLYRVVLSNRGAVVKSWILKKYVDTHKKPLELVDQAADEHVGFPFMVWVDDAVLREKLKNALFEVKATSDHAPATVSFEYSDGTTTARKEFRFEHGSYLAEVSSEVTDSGAPVTHGLAWRGGFGDRSVAVAHGNVSLVFAKPGKVDRIAYSKVEDGKKLDGPFLYGGLEDLFFAGVLMPPENAPPGTLVPEIRGFRNDFKPQGADSPVPLAGTGIGGQAVNNFRVFVGPKSWDVLNSVYPQPGGAQLKAQGQPVVTLGDLLDFGWFWPIAKPLFLILRWIYEHMVRNYGWAIVIITIAINFALFPLKLNSMKSALKMQRLAPQLRVINEKYKKLKFNDPKKAEQNAEVMALYKVHGVNPLGSCLPMLLQLPFLYAFYKVLSISIEMRHAPWILWIHDMSTKDPYYILPIVMTGTMFILQKMTPQTTTDPAQQKMFQMMPLIFGFMFMNVSSGLVLYWLTGNVIGIAQQWYINKTGLAPQPAGKSSAAKRR